jgi:hypothetical protein
MLMNNFYGVNTTSQLGNESGNVAGQKHFLICWRPKAFITAFFS